MGQVEMTMREAIRWDLEPTFLHFQFSVWTFDNDRSGVLARVIGEYRPGSAGRYDAIVMQQRISQACELANADTLVVDLRSLEYEWGDDVDVDPHGRRLRALSIIRPEQLAAFAPMLGREQLRTEFDAALDEAERIARPTDIVEKRPPRPENVSRSLVRLNLEISEIDRLCRVWTSEGTGRMAWLAFYGECRSDSDALWIQWQIDAADAIVEPGGMLIDVRELDVASRAFPFAPRTRNRSVLVVTRPEQRLASDPQLEGVVRTELEVAAEELEALVQLRRTT